MTEKTVNRRKYLTVVVLIAIVLVASVGVGLYFLLFQTGNKDTIKIGITAELTGDWSIYGPYQITAYQLAADAINEAGGVLGRPVELVIGDTRTTAEGSITACRKLLDVDNVVVVLGESSGTMPSLLPMFSQSKCALISPWAGSSTLDNLTGMGINGFRACVSDSFPYMVLSNYFYQNLTKRTLAILAPDNIDEMGECLLFKQEFEQLGGTVVKWIDCASGQTSYESELRQVFEMDPVPDIVHMPFTQPDAIVAFRDWYEIGAPTTQWSCGNNWEMDADFQAVCPEPGILDGLIGWTSGARIGLTPDVTTQAFLNAFTEKVGPELQCFCQTNCWDILTLSALAMQAAGTASREGVMNYLKPVSNSPGVKVYSFAEGKAYLEAGQEINYEGASGPVDFNEYGNTPGKIQIIKIADNAWTVVATVQNF